MKHLPAPSTERGVTLVELVVAIVIISVALAGVLVVFLRNTSASADPMIWHQATAVAEAYLEEVLTKNFTADGPEGSRADYDDIFDYNTIVSETPPRDQNGNQIASLTGYAVTVQVSAAALGAPAVPNTDAARIQVTVATPFGGSIVVSGYRTNDGT
jgi:MSHA pilin protein MshD